MSFEQETFGAAIAYMNQTLAGAGSLKGEKGDKGDTGETGPKGEKGDTGESGASAYDIALENGFEGSEKDWLNSLTPTNIATTTDYTMPGSYEGRLLFKEIAGKTEQLTSTGKNIGAFKCYTGNSNYASLVTSSDISFIKKGKTYTVSAYITAPSKTGAYWNRACGVFDEDVSFTVEAGTNRYSYTFVASADGRTRGELPFLSKQGNSDGVYITPFDVQIEEGEVATAYEPYGVGTPFIRSVEINGIKTHGKNYCPISGYSGPSKVWMSIELDAKKYLGYGTTFVSGSGKILFEVVGIKNGVTTQISNDTYSTSVNVKNVPTQDYDKVVIGCYSNSDDNVLTDTFIYLYDEPVEEELVYEPYTESSVTFSQPIKLNKIGDLSDAIVDGKVINKVGNVLIDGSITPMTVVAGNNGGTVIGYRYNDIGMWAINTNRNNNRICDRLQPPATTLPNDFKDCEIGHWGFNDAEYKDEFFIFCIEENLTTPSEAQLWLSTHPIRILFELATPITDIPVADQVALNSLKTCGGTTYLEIDSQLEPDFECEYGTSKIGSCALNSMLAGYNAEIIAEDNAKRIAALEATIVNNI